MNKGNYASPLSELIFNFKKFNQFKSHLNLSKLNFNFFSISNFLPFVEKKLTPYLCLFKSFDFCFKLKKMDLNFTIIEKNNLYELNQNILFYALFIMIPIGLALNLLHLVFYSRKKYINKTMNAYFIIISINNILALGVTSLRFISLLDMYEFDRNTLLGCRLTQFIIRLSYASVSWLNYLITLDRLIYVLFNHKYKILVNRYSISQVIFCMYIFLTLANSPNFWIKSIRLFENSTNQTNIKICYATYEVIYAREFLAQIIGIYLPIILMISTNGLLIHKVWSLKNKLNKFKDLKYLFSLIFSNIIFILALMPLSILLMLYLIFMINPAIKLYFPHFDKYSLLLEILARISSCFNFSFGIFVPIFVNPLLRQEFFNMISELGSAIKKFFNLIFKK